MMMHSLDHISELLERSAAAVRQSRETCRKVRQSLAKTQASLREADAIQIDTRIALEEMRREMAS